MPSITHSGSLNREGTLQTPFNQNVVSNYDDPAVQSALFTIEKNYDQKTKQDNRNKLIQDLFESGFEVRSPDGTRKINSKLLQQALWRLVARTKILDFSIHGNNRPEEIEKLVTEGVSTILDNGGFARSCRDKNGVFFKMYMWGDGFMHVGANNKDNQEKPIIFSPVSNTNIYTDTYATGIRTGTVGRAVNECVVVNSMSWDEACQEYPQIKKKGGVGEIKRYLNGEKELERDYLQTYKTAEDKVEIAHYYNISKRNYTVFAGPAATILKQEKGESYPFVMKGEPYIPILQFICMPSSKGFYNHGVGSMLYELAVMTQRLMNLALGHIEDNTYPITLVNVPKGEAGKFFNKLRSAHEMRRVGRKGYVAMEYDNDNPNAGRVDSQALLTNNLFQEWNVMFDRLYDEVKRLGINLDEGERNTDPTATQVISEEENANMFVKQVMEYNASETQFSVDLTMDFMQKFISPDNNTPINSTTRIDMQEDQVRADQFTYGAIVDELGKNKYFTKVNARSGAIPSNIMQQAQIQRAMQVAPPGSPAFTKLSLKWMRLNDQDVRAEDVAPQEQAQEQASGAAPEEGATTAAETERKSISPNLFAQNAPAF